MTSVTLFGGVARIGGNCVLLEDADSSLLVDLGKDFYEYQRYFEFPFKLPSKSVERELLKTGVLPRIRSQRSCSAASLFGKRFFG
jgi:mRNA degradation ribonuclease J1/J2